MRGCAGNMRWTTPQFFIVHICQNVEFSDPRTHGIAANRIHGCWFRHFLYVTGTKQYSSAWTAPCGSPEPYSTPIIISTQQWYSTNTLRNASNEYKPKSGTLQQRNNGGAPVHRLASLHTEAESPGMQKKTSI